MVALASASAPRAGGNQAEATIAASYDATWDAAIAEFSAQAWAIDTQIRSAGSITTDWVTVGDDEYAVCASAIASTIKSQALFNIQIAARDAQNSIITVKAQFKILRRFGETEVWNTDCRSTGKLEAQIQSSVGARAITLQRGFAEGAKGGTCYRNGTCNAGFVCYADKICRAPPAAGTRGGACFSDGSCTAPFACTPDEICGDPATVGTAGGACFGNLTCDAGLACSAERLCVAPVAAPAASPPPAPSP